MKRLILLLALLLPLAQRATAEPASCFVGLSAGTTASTTRLEDGGMHLDVGANALQVGPEIGCSVTLAGVVVGGLVRYDFTDAKTSIGNNKIEVHGRWMAAATLGLAVNPHATVYGLGGLAGTELKIPAARDITHIGAVAGAGIAFDIGRGAWSAFAEFNHIRYAEETIEGTKVVPTETIARVGLRYAIGR